MKHKTTKPSKAPSVLISLIIFTFVAVTGFSLITGNKQDSNVGTSKASATEPADINNDNKVDIFDLSILLSNWNKTGVNTSDLNSDSVVNIFDLSMLLSKWGAVGVQQTRNCAPTAANTMTNTTSHLCGFPDTTNTGVPVGTTLKKVPEQVSSGVGWVWDTRGWVEVYGANAVFDGYEVAANVNISGNGAIVRNCLVYTSGDFGISIRASNVTVQHCTVRGMNSTSGRVGYAITNIGGSDSGIQILSNNISWTANGICLEEGLVQDNYIHDMGYSPGDHTNGYYSGGGNTNQLTIRHNTIFNQLDQTDAISLFQDFGVQANRLIDNNLLAGGAYTLYAGKGPTEAATSNIKITNNSFSRLVYPNSGYYGPVVGYYAAGTGNLWSNNIWDDTGTPVNP